MREIFETTKMGYEKFIEDIMIKFFMAEDSVPVKILPFLSQYPIIISYFIKQI